MELSTLFFGLLAASLVLLLGEVSPPGRGQALLPRVLAVGLTLPLALLAGYHRLNGEAPPWPPIDALGILVYCLPLTAVVRVLPRRRLGLGLALAGLGLWLWYGLEPYHGRHWVGSQPMLRLAGTASILLVLGFALDRCLSREEQCWWLPVGLLGLLVIGALLVAQSSGASALLLGCLGIAVGSSSAVCLRAKDPAAFAALAWPVTLGAGGLLLNGVLYASTPASSGLCMAGALGVLCVPLPHNRAAPLLRLFLALALAGWGLCLGWPESDPYAGGW